jgi:FkbM family methyltransferase
LDEGSCIFDVGANIGLFTLFVGQRCKSAVIYAFEPVPPIFEILRLNAALYGLNVTLCEYGLASKTGSDVFTYYPHVSVVSGRFADGSDREVVKTFVLNQAREGASEALLDEMVRERLTGERIRCQLRTISDVMHEHGIKRVDLLKIDAEGSEGAILAGAKRLISQHKPLIVFENWRSFTDAEQTLRPLLLLRDLGYVFFHPCWLRRRGDLSLFMPAENPIDTLPTEVLALVPLTPEDRFLRHDQVNIFACHMNSLPKIRSLFEKFNPAESGRSCL